MRVKLTDRFLSSSKIVLPPEGKRLMVWDTVTRGLGLQATSKGAKSWKVIRRVKGKGKEQPLSITLGSYPDVSLAEARSRADDVLRDMRTGIDPRQKAAAERKAKAEAEAAERAKEANLFSAVAEDFVRRRLKGKRTAVQIAQLVERQFVRRWGDRPVSSIGRRNIIDMVEEIAETSPTAAKQALTYAKLMFDWMVLRDIIPSSPCHPIKLSGLIPDLPKPRDRVLCDAELRLVWRAAWPADATAEDVYPVGPYARLLMILGCRRSELAKATWSEFDLDNATWTLPGERVKNGDPD